MKLESAAAPSGRWAHLALQLGVMLVLALLVFAGVRHVQVPPAPAPTATIADGEFSSTRALQVLSTIARVPHPIGSDEDAQVRDTLVARLRAMGYEPQVQTGRVLVPTSRALAQASNVVVRVRGTAPAKALLLAAHYDSVPTGPGAADDGASVAALLETLRALKSGPPLRNDLIVLFTDGEEAGLLGANLFEQQHPWARDVGLALNFEYRGNAGPIWMFETSDGNGPVVREWQAALPHALGSSLLYEAYRVMPNDTDLSVFKPHFPGMNFAAGEQYNSYHTALDSVQALDRGTLQQQGEMMLALTRHFGAIPLDHLRGDNVVYFDLPGLGVVSYGSAFAGVLSLAVLALFAVVVTIAARAGHAAGASVAKAALAVLLSCVLLAALCQALWLGLLQVHPGYQRLLHGSTYNGGWYLSAFALLSVAAFGVAMRLWQKKFAPAELILGALAVNMLALAASTILMPGLTFLFAWPALPVLAALAVLWRRPRADAGGMRSAVLLLACAPAVLMFTPLVYLLYFALTPMLLAVTVVLACLLYCVVSPLLLVLGQHRFPARAACVASLALFAGGAWTSGFDLQRREPDNLMYLQSETGGPAWIASTDDELDGWTRPLLGAKSVQQVVKSVLGPKSAPMWTAPVAAEFPAAPAIEVISDQTQGATRVLQLSVHSGRRVPRLVVDVDGAAVQQSQVDGQPYLSRPAEHWRLNAYGLQEQPVRITLTVASGSPFTVRTRDIGYGLPVSVDARPEMMMSQPFRDSDTLQVAHLQAFR